MTILYIRNEFVKLYVETLCSKGYDLHLCVNQTYTEIYIDGGLIPNDRPPSWYKAAVC